MTALQPKKLCKKWAEKSGVKQQLKGKSKG